MDSKRRRVDANIVLHQILDYMVSSGESEDDPNDPLHDIEDVLDNFALSSSRSDVFFPIYFNY